MLKAGGLTKLLLKRIGLPFHNGRASDGGANMSDLLQARIAEAYRWHRRLGARVTAALHCHVVADPGRPGVWESNHLGSVTAETDEEIDAVFAAMDTHLAHSNWRVAHTDGFTPDAFLARLAFADFKERFVVIQMALEGPYLRRVTSARPAAGRD